MKIAEKTIKQKKLKYLRMLEVFGVYNQSWFFAKERKKYNYKIIN